MDRCQYVARDGTACPVTTLVAYGYCARHCAPVIAAQVREEYHFVGYETRHLMGVERPYYADNACAACGSHDWRNVVRDPAREAPGLVMVCQGCEAGYPLTIVPQFALCADWRA